MKHLQQGRFAFKINSNLTLVIFLPYRTVCLPQLACPSSSGRHLPPERCFESVLHIGPSITPGNLQQFSEYYKCLNGRVKPLPSLLRNMFTIVSCNKLPNPGHKIVVNLGTFPFPFFLLSHFCAVSERREKACTASIYLSPLGQQMSQSTVSHLSNIVNDIKTN